MSMKKNLDSCLKIQCDGPLSDFASLPRVSVLYNNYYNMNYKLNILIKK